MTSLKEPVLGSNYDELSIGMVDGPGPKAPNEAAFCFRFRSRVSQMTTLKPILLADNPRDAELALAAPWKKNSTSPIKWWSAATELKSSTTSLSRSFVARERNPVVVFLIQDAKVDGLESEND
jgi:hypothetical protein